MNENNKSSEVVFFLGAGASIAAGVPDTRDFVKEFIKDLEDRDPEWKEIVEDIVKKLQGWTKSDVDVELLLETLTKLENRSQEPLLLFYTSPDFIYKDYPRKRELIERLKDFIKSKAIVSEDRVGYLKPLVSFVEESKLLDIISVNYDTCIEQLCNVYKLAYQDGFDVYWNPVLFGSANLGIRLYKLHGSAMWYESSRGGFIKLPIMWERSSLQLITGERAENLMLYPMQKWYYAEPLLELLVEIKHVLESTSCKFLLVVGYSFRDEHITRILWDAARENRELTVILVDPSSYSIYSRKLRYYDFEKRISSPLEGKVICLPYKFEEIFPFIRTYYVRNLRDAARAESQLLEAELKGPKQNWIHCALSFAKAEHVDKTSALLQVIDKKEIQDQWEFRLEVPFMMAFNLLCNRRDKEATTHLTQFNDFLYELAIQGLKIDLRQDPLMVKLYFTYPLSNQGIGYIGVKPFKDTIARLLAFCETRSAMLKNEINDLKPLTSRLLGLKSYLDPFPQEQMRYDEYFALRSKEPDADKLRVKVDETYGQRQSPPIEKLRPLIEEFEKNILAKMFLEGQPNSIAVNV